MLKLLIRMNLNNILEELNVTQRAFGEMSGINRNTIRKMCNNTNKTVSLETLARIITTANVLAEYSRINKTYGIFDLLEEAVEDLDSEV